MENSSLLFKGTREAMKHQTVPRIDLTLSQRRRLFLAQLSVLLGYLIINRLMSYLGEGTTFDIWLDEYIPLRPVWVVPYLSALVWWGLALLCAHLKMEDALYLPFVVGWIITCLIGYSIFIFYPNYMVRPEVVGDGWAVWFVRFVYSNDRTYNAFPSMHLWLTVYLTLFWVRWKPRWRWAMWSYTFIVALSTLFTGQHWIMDVVGGSLLALFGYFAGFAALNRLHPLWGRYLRQADR
jgi:membrane-associated phospholipid phosphatase